METNGSHENSGSNGNDEGFVVPPAPLRLDGAGVILREWADGHLDDLVEVYADPEIARWTPVASPFDAEAARAYSTRRARVGPRARGAARDHHGRRPPQGRSPAVPRSVGRA